MASQDRRTWLGLRTLLYNVRLFRPVNPKEQA